MRVAWKREPGVTLEWVAADFGFTSSLRRSGWHADIDAHIRELAAACRLTPGVYFAQAVTAAAARDAEDRVRRLQSTLEPLLAHTSPQELLVAVARALTRDQPGPSTAAGDVHEST